jgi:hypothetical protein
MIAIGMAKAVLPEDQVIREITQGRLNLDRTNCALQYLASADRCCRPFANIKKPQRVRSKARLVAFPDGNQTFIKAFEPATRLGHNEPLKMFESPCKLISIYNHTVST